MAIQTKYLVVKKFGWKRVCKNTQRFGWILDEAIQHNDTTVTTSYEGRVYDDKIYIDEHKSYSTKVTIHLSFYRDKEDYTNLPVIFPLELIYNIVFFIRRFIGFFLPLLTIGLVLVAVIGDLDSLLNETYFSAILISAFALWLGLIIIESILAIIASKILRYRRY